MWRSLLALGFFMLVSCGDILDSEMDKKRVPLDSLDSVIKPLHKQNFWYYDIYLYDPVDDSLKSSDETILEMVLKDTVINGAKWFTDDTLGRVWYTNKYDGLHKITKKLSVTTEALILQYPGKTGSEFTDDGGVRWKITSTDSVVAVEAGSYHCYCFESYNPSTGHYTRAFYSPQNGLIMRELFTLEDGSKPRILRSERLLQSILYK